MRIAGAASTVPPFNECPALGHDTSCGILIDVTDAGTQIIGDPSQGPYDGADDTLIGVVNNSSRTLGHVSLASDTDLFGFDSDGLCTASGAPSGCPFGSTGYEGPGTSFANISSNSSGGDVSFTGGLAPGATAYFSLEEAVTADTVVTGGPSVAEQGGPSNSSEHPTTCSTARPVNCATGDFWHTFTDAKVPGNGVPLEFQRTYSSNQATIDSPLGYGWTDSYNLSLSGISTSAVTVNQEDGSSVTFPSNGSGGFTAPRRVLASLSSNSDGTYTFSRYKDHIQYVFSATGQLLREIDRNGYTTTLNYTSGKLTSVSDPTGRTLTFAYAGSHIASVSDPAGKTTSFSYDGGGNLVKTTDPLGRAWSFTYDGSHLLLSMSDPNGGTTTNTYDSSSRVIEQVDPAGRQTAWSYSGDNASATGGTTTITDGRGNQTTFDYSNLELMTVTHAAGTPQAAKTKYQYDALTLGRTSITDPDGNVTSKTYDARGNLTSSTDPLGRTTRYSYDGSDDLTSLSDPVGTSTTYSYDGNGNVTSSSTPVSGQTATTTYAHDAQPGQVTGVTDPDGNTTQYTYDAQGDRTSATDATGAKTTYAFDVMGRLTAETKPDGNASGGSGHSTQYTYDARGQLTAQTDPLGRTTSYRYDGNGNRVSMTDPNGHTTTETYDADDELTKTNRPDGSALSTAWDAAGNMASQTDAAGHVTSYGYDFLNRVTSSTDPKSRTTSYGYDPAGHETSATNPDGQTTTYTYDAAGEATNVTYSDAVTPSVSESYDADGRRSSMSDGSGTSSYQYNELGRMTRADYPTGSGQATVQYGYDLAGHLTSLTYPNGQTVQRQYDPAGHLTSVRDWLGNTTNFTYDSDGNVTNQAYPNGVQTNLGYDTADRTTSIAHTKGDATLARFDYSRDPNGAVTTESSPSDDGGADHYGRDSLDRITSASAGSYGYDAGDNLTTFGGRAQSFDAASQLVSRELPPAPPQPPNPPTCPGAPQCQPPQPPTCPGSPQCTPVLPLASVQLDTTASGASSGPSAVTTRPLRTRSRGELLVALVSTGLPQPRRGAVLGVSGAGLRWTLVKRSASKAGAAEIWQARAPKPVSGARITARLPSGKRTAAITAAAFTGPAPVIAASVTAQGQRGAPLIPIVAPAGSLVWAVGRTSARGKLVPIRGQRLISPVSNASGSGWAEQAAAPNGGNSSHSSIGLTGPKSGAWGMAAVTIAPAARMRIRELGALNPSIGGTQTFAYNGEGDRTQVTNPDGTTAALSYDSADRLTRIGDTVQYAYNGDGLRVQKTVAGAATSFTWDQSSSVPQLLQENGTSYIYGPDGAPIEQITGSTPTYLHQDQQGSTRLLTDTNGNTVGSYNYDPWGRVTHHSGTATTNLQYNGEYTDDETGYQYLRARYYDPTTGQFLTSDPLLAATRARYGYAGNDPVDISDPNGQFALTLMGGAIGGVAGGVVGGMDYALTHDGKFNGRAFGAAVAGGAVGGAISGACIGTTAQLVLCGAAGGAAGTLTSELVAGQGINPAAIAGGGAIGGVTGALVPFPTVGRLPSKFINLIRPGTNATRMYGNGLVGGIAGSLFQHLFDPQGAC